jgi:hypothetical protein
VNGWCRNARIAIKLQMRRQTWSYPGQPNCGQSSQLAKHRDTTQTPTSASRFGPKVKN